MRKKIKIGDKVYCVACLNDKIYIEEKEILYHELDIYSYNNTYLLKDNTWVSTYKNTDTFIQIEPITKNENKFYYRTKNKAIQEAIKKIKSWIKGFQGSILEHKELLKELNKELKNDRRI